MNERKFNRIQRGIKKAIDRWHKKEKKETNKEA